MPRASNGTYSLYTPGNPVQSLTTISSAWANNTLDDIAQALTDSLSRTGNGGMQAPLALAAGAIGTPGLTWSNETTSGLYRAGAGDFRWAISGSDVFTITSSGISPVGISGTIGGSPTWTGSHTFNNTATFTTGAQFTRSVTVLDYPISLASVNPGLMWNDIDGTTNNKIWDMIVLSEQMRFRVKNDDGSGTTNYITVDRTGTTIDSIAFAATALTWNGSAMVNVASSPTWTGTHLFQGSAPRIRFNSTGAGVNEKQWHIQSNSSGTFVLETRTDADGAGTTVLQISRTGTTPNNLVVNAASLTINATNSTTFSNTSSINTFAGQTVFTNSVGPTISNNSPYMIWDEIDGGTDQRLWRASVSSAIWRLQTLTDGGSTGAQPILISRTGTTVSSIALTSTALTWNGKDVPNVASSPTWTGQHVFSYEASAGAIQINNTFPVLAFYESDAAANNRAWRAIVNAEQFSLQASSDDYTFSQSFMDVDRTGTTIDTIALTAAPATGTIALSAGSVTVNGNEVGYRGIRQFRNITGDAVTNTTDPGGVIVYGGSGGHTLTLSAGVPAKEIIIVMNGGTGNLTISPIGTMNWYNGSGSISSGNRTLAVGGVATLLSSGSNVWSIWGSGLT